MSVYTKLNEAREKFHASKIKKTGFNSFAKYDYFELADFIVPALTIFKECGLSGHVSFGSDLATLTIVDVDKPDDRIVITSPMSTCEMKGLHAVQQLGAVQSYLRRYLWVAALEIVEHDALDATTGKKGDGPIASAKAGIGADLPDDVKNTLIDIATQSADYVKEGQPRKAYEFINNKKLDDEQMVWMWARLDSKTRAAIKASKDIPL